jgi:hypothetical protein
MKKTIILITIFLVSVIFSYYITKNIITKNNTDTSVERVVEIQEKNIESIE